ncbi:GNAT family N-acetyltransferase [bacterium]|nr:GNAT family N-acetyltransferase [bacterium]
MEKIKLTPKVLNSFSGQDLFYSNQKIAQFLNTHLDEFGDSVDDILKCLDYVFEKNLGKGGFVLLGLLEEEIIGAVVINETGMSKYIPENILVYIAVHRDFRGKGLGKQLMEQALKLTKGDVALHVEPDNPAKKLYERLGFTNKYLEMRLVKD